MDPDEVEFIGEKLSIGIIPNFNFDPIHLISNTIGALNCKNKTLIVKIIFLLLFIINFRSIPSWSCNACASLVSNSYEKATKVPDSASNMDGS